MKKDYIDILLSHLSEQRLSYANSEYFIHQKREQLAFKALADTLNDQQHELLLRYDEERNASASVSESLLARQAFLLAREIFR